MTGIEAISWVLEVLEDQEPVARNPRRWVRSTFHPAPPATLERCGHQLHVARRAMQFGSIPSRYRLRNTRTEQIVVVP